MTFAIGVATRSAVLLMADRKLNGVGTLADYMAKKVCRIETLNSHGILSYAGVGAKGYAQPLELSTWVEQLLRGGNGQHTECMQMLSQAATEQGIAKLLPGDHTFMFVGFVDGRGMIWLVMSGKFSPEAEEQKRLSRSDFAIVAMPIPEKRSDWLTFIGSGIPSAPAVMHIVRRAARELKKSSRFPIHRDRASALLALANRMVAEKHPEEVSPECICCWSDIKKTGLHWIYDKDGKPEGQQEGNFKDIGEFLRGIEIGKGAIPSVAAGFDLSELMKHTGPIMQKHIVAAIEAQMEGRIPPELDEEKLREAAAKVDFTPKRKF